MDTPEQTLLRDLLNWEKGQDLAPLIKRAVEIVGPAVVVDLSWDAATACDQLIQHLEVFMG